MGDTEMDEGGTEAVKEGGGVSGGGECTRHRYSNRRRCHSIVGGRTKGGGY